MSFVVGFARRARADIAGIVSWIERRDPAFAVRWRERLLTEATAKLEADPFRYPVADEAADLGLDLRELLHGRRPHVYRVLFAISGRFVTVLRIRHASQDRPDAGDV